MQSLTIDLQKMTNYLFWLVDRGLVSPRALVPTSAPSSVQSEPVTSRHLPALFVIDLPSLSGEEKNLFDKMRAATKWGGDQYDVIPSEDFFRDDIAISADIYVVMGDEIARRINSAFDFSADAGRICPLGKRDSVFIVTHHPADLLADPQQKVACWTHLQRAIGFVQGRAAMAGSASQC